MNSIDCDLDSTELEILSLEHVDTDIVSSDSIHTYPVALYNKFAILKK